MSIEYYFNNLDPTGFQRLINALLVARFGERIRLLPLRGPDGGQDAQIPPGRIEAEFIETVTRFLPLLPTPLGYGRYVFQVKHHRTIDTPSSSPRNAVVTEFGKELKENILRRTGKDKVDRFFLVTNVPASKEAIEKIDEKRSELLNDREDLQADVLWQEHVNAWLDGAPNVWTTFPEIFPGRIVPPLGSVAHVAATGIEKSLRLVIANQFSRDDVVRFKQIDLEQSLARLFVDLDVAVPAANEWSNFYSDHVTARQHRSIRAIARGRSGIPSPSIKCLPFLMDEKPSYDSSAGVKFGKFILQGGPGQGKSTITQMLAQIYRSQLLGHHSGYDEFSPPERARFPVRIELRLLADWITTTRDGSIEEYIATTFSKEAGGVDISVTDLHRTFENTRVLLIFDGLDEIGQDESRDIIIAKIMDCVARLEGDLRTDVRVVITTRPPAIVGRTNKFPGFVSLQILPLDDEIVDDYIGRWTHVQCTDTYERDRIVDSFNTRRDEVHVQALIKNPMQLSVLLHFIRLKGEAFPDRRAELYREYFKTVIDRDVEKTPRVRALRDEIETLHELLGFEIHSLAETDRGSGTLGRSQLISIVEGWLRAEGRSSLRASDLFALGEERLGLIVALKGEGGDTRYGFEIQPVREYFAAAFVNERISGNAHDVFEEMVRRPFWREVALFLAGLRRANEKADLLSRARALDEDPKHGWRQDGRVVVLQLLQEGVLTTPGHVHRDALSYLLLFLDPSITRARNEPKGMLAALPELVRVCGARSHQQMLQRFLLDCKSSCDRTVVLRLHLLANAVFSKSQMLEHWRNFSPSSKRLNASVRIQWPTNGKDIEEASQEPWFWPEKPSSEWAAVLYRAGLADSTKTGIPLRSQYHQLLLHQFAFEAFPHSRPYSTLHQQPINPASDLAVWTLVGNMQRICSVLNGTLILEEREDTENVDYSGLEDDAAATVQAIVESSGEVLKALLEEQRLTPRFDDLFDVIDGCLERNEISGWTACRCGVAILEALLEDSFSVSRGVRGFIKARRYTRHQRIREHRQLRERRAVQRLVSWRTLRSRLTPFYRLALPLDGDAGRTFAHRIVRHGASTTCPSHVVVGGAFVAVHTLVTRYLNREPVSEWVGTLRIPRFWFRTLLDVDRPDLEKALSHLALRRFTLRGPTKALPASLVQKILGVVRRTTDESVAAGALVPLIDSSFLSFAEDALVLRMLEADSAHADVGGRLFRSHPGYRRMLSGPLEKIARSIVAGEVRVSQATATAASDFLAENEVVSLAPLKSLPGLQIG